MSNYPVYTKALEFFDDVVDDTEIMLRNLRGREIARQLLRAAGSISANIEEGYGRGSSKEFIHFLRIARGSARESKGWYRRSKKFLPDELINKRMEEVDEVSALLVSTIHSIERKLES